MTQVSVHLERLVALELVGVNSGRWGSQFVYELLAAEDTAHGVPLIDAAKLHAYDPNFTGQKGHLTGGAGPGPLGTKVA